MFTGEEVTPCTRTAFLHGAVTFLLEYDLINPFAVSEAFIFN